ncbi:hypothetical protein A2U01_0101320, partial [Trifolium medium]|nr:hypothetical protein [Trifolium medium]
KDQVRQSKLHIVSFAQGTIQLVTVLQ